MKILQMLLAYNYCTFPPPARMHGMPAAAANNELRTTNNEQASKLEAATYKQSYTKLLDVATEK